MIFTVMTRFDNQDSNDTATIRRLTETFNMNSGMFWSPVGDAIEEKAKPVAVLTSGNGFEVEKVVAAEKIFHELLQLRRRARERWERELDKNVHKIPFLAMHDQQIRNLKECLRLLSEIRIELIFVPLRVAKVHAERTTA